MDNFISLRLQCIVFALVFASFTNIYITQPVLPILQSEFAADMVLVSFSVSAVILGILNANYFVLGYLIKSLLPVAAALSFLLLILIDILLTLSHSEFLAINATLVKRSHCFPLYTLLKEIDYAAITASYLGAT